MMEEISLKNKINVLQAEMLNFHQKISPVKSKNPAEKLMLSYPEKSKFSSTCISILLAFLKISVCITGPTIFPTIVYCIEGSSQLFWQVTAVSCIISLLLAMMVVPLMCLSMKQAKDVLEDTLKSINILLDRVDIFKQLHAVTTSDFMKKNVNKVLYPLIILFATSLVTFTAYLKDMPILFYGSLMVISFVSGIFATLIYNLVNNQELLLPLHSPCKVRMEYATPSPKAKKELPFSSSMKKSNSSPALQFSTPTPWYETNLEYIETQSITAFLPDLSPRSYHETIERAHNLKLPFKSFF